MSANHLISAKPLSRDEYENGAGRARAANPQIAQPRVGIQGPRHIAIDRGGSVTKYRIGVDQAPASGTAYPRAALEDAPLPADDRGRAWRFPATSETSPRNPGHAPAQASDPNSPCEPFACPATRQ
jgi:hypothetical protein